MLNCKEVPEINLRRLIQQGLSVTKDLINETMHNIICNDLTRTVIRTANSGDEAETIQVHKISRSYKNSFKL